MSVPTLPVHVQEAVFAIAADPKTHKVWLIGSRANGTATAISDWDLLVESGREPVATDRRFKDVDVLHLGPTGRLLLEGMPSSHELSFANFQWSETSSSTATYRGVRFLQVGPEVVRDSPSVVSQASVAVLLWSRERLGLGNAVNDRADG